MCNAIVEQRGVGSVSACEQTKLCSLPVDGFSIDLDILLRYATCQTGRMNLALSTYHLYRIILIEKIVPMSNEREFFLYPYPPPTSDICIHKYDMFGR